jgi:hypothetical protein
MIGGNLRFARWKMLTVLVCIELSASVAITNAQGKGQHTEADKESNDPIYTGGDAAVPSGKRAVLDASDEREMRILWNEGVWKLPYDRITNLYVSVSRPSAMVELSGSLLTAPFMLGALKNRKLYLSVSFDEANARPGKCIFLVRQGYGQMVELLSKRSKQNVVFETYDAKRRLSKPK